MLGPVFKRQCCKWSVSAGSICKYSVSPFMYHQSRLWKSLGFLWICSSEHQTCYLGIFMWLDLFLTAWPEKPFCKDVDMCKYSFLCGLCCSENCTEGKRTAKGLTAQFSNLWDRHHILEEYYYQIEAYWKVWAQHAWACPLPYHAGRP